MEVWVIVVIVIALVFFLFCGVIAAAMICLRGAAVESKSGFTDLTIIDSSKERPPAPGAPPRESDGDHLYFYVKPKEVQCVVLSDVRKMAGNRTGARPEEVPDDVFVAAVVEECARQTQCSAEGAGFAVCDTAASTFIEIDTVQLVTGSKHVTASARRPLLFLTLDTVQPQGLAKAKHGPSHTVVHTEPAPPRPLPAPRIYPDRMSLIETDTPVKIVDVDYYDLDTAQRLEDIDLISAIDHYLMAAPKAPSTGTTTVQRLTAGSYAATRYTVAVSEHYEMELRAFDAAEEDAPLRLRLVSLDTTRVRYCFTENEQWAYYHGPFTLGIGRWCVRAEVFSTDHSSLPVSSSRVFTVQEPRPDA